MKIFRIPIEDKFRPNHQDFVWPPQNAQPGEDRGVEQDFDNWLLNHPHLLTYLSYEADYAYIPIYWNRFYINTLDENHRWGGGVELLVEEIEACHSFNMPMFTVAEADVKWLKPQINWNEITVFCASRRDNNGSIDIPLLSAPRVFEGEILRKKWLASFLGNLRTDGVRIEMYDELKERSDCRIEHAGAPMDEFTRTMLESYIALAPRGQGAQSFRMYEAMQLGTVPLYISDMDCRPFKNWIDWDICSLYAPNVEGLNGYLDVMSENKDKLVHMGELAKYTYDDYLSYGKWCKFLIKELELL